MAKKRYDNGEIVTTGRIEDEDWYRNLYQPFLEFVNGREGKGVEVVCSTRRTNGRSII